MYIYIYFSFKRRRLPLITKTISRTKLEITDRAAVGPERENPDSITVKYHNFKLK